MLRIIDEHGFTHDLDETPIGARIKANRWLGDLTARGYPGATLVEEPDPAPDPLDARWSPLQFLERFTEAEQIAIVTAAASDPALRLWYDKAMASQEIVAGDPRTQAGMAALVAAGLITEARRIEILGGDEA